MKQGERLRQDLERMGWRSDKDALIAPLESMHLHQRVFEENDLKWLLNNMLSRRRRILATIDQFPEEARVSLTDVDQLLLALQNIIK